MGSQEKFKLYFKRFTMSKKTTTREESKELSIKLVGSTVGLFIGVLALVLAFSPCWGLILIMILLIR